MDALTDSRLDIGGNNPPERIEIERAVELVATANGWIAERPEIGDADQAKEAGDFVDKLRTSKKNLAAALKADIAPHDEAIAEVKAKYREPVSLIETALTALLEKSGAWLVRERARIAAEKAIIEAEARRKREEAERAERERLEAQRRLDEERRRLAEETERRRIEAERQQTEIEKVAADFQASADLERVEAERVEAARVATEAEAAAKSAREAERAAVRKPEVAAIKSGETGRRAMTLKTYWSAVIEDEAAALESYKDHPVVRKAALAAALQVAGEAARTSKDEAAAPLGFRFVKEERAS